MTETATAWSATVPGTTSVGNLRRNKPFQPQTRLRNEHQFKLIWQSGINEVGRLMVLRALPAPDGQVRIAIVTSRRFSPRAVVRNRARRLLREACRQLFPELSPWWIVFLPRTNLKASVIHAVVPEARWLLGQAGIITEPPKP